jgi:NAD(P)-dependent dehydrogenase (short-subunit alcohol dehydrogenase family)
VKTFVVIGASTGLGRATANHLAETHRVIVAGRDVAQLRVAVPRATPLAIDLRDLASVKQCADELATHGPIDGIACNAGVQSTTTTKRTHDGHEETFGVNHLAHFALVMHLVTTNTFAPTARIAWIGSGTLDPDDRGARRFGFRGGRYTSARELAAGTGDSAVDDAQRGRDAYATSKLCNLLAMNAIARRTTQLATFALDPGLMPGTGLARDRGAITRAAWHTLMRVAGAFMPGASTARRSGAALAWLLTTPTLANTTGRYFDFGRHEVTPCAIARDHAHADELYATSLALCGFTRDPLA